MLLRRKQKLFREFTTFRRLTALTSIVLIYLIFCRTSFRPKNSNAGRWLPNYDVQKIPRFLHRSPYRESPDFEYERSVSEALQKIEREALGPNEGRYNTAEDRIWQIRLGNRPDKGERGPDSLMFEKQNPEWQYSLVTDMQANEFIANVLWTVPDLKRLYDSYPFDVIRSDLLRYLLLWFYGGYYADTDVFPAKPIKSCPTLQPVLSDLDAGSANISLVVGIEIDEPHASPQLMRDWRWIRRYGLIQYTMYAPQRFSPILRETIVRVLSHTRQHNRYSLPLIGPTYSEETILEVTGPGVFTDTVLDVLSETLPSTHPLITASLDADREIGDLVTEGSGEVDRRVTWAPFHKIREPVCVDAGEAAPGKSMGGVCVLPVSVWGNGQRHSGAEGFRSEHACVNHRFGGSWKKGWLQRQLHKLQQ